MNDSRSDEHAKEKDAMPMLLVCAWILRSSELHTNAYAFGIQHSASDYHRSTSDRNKIKHLNEENDGKRDEKQRE